MLQIHIRKQISFSGSGFFGEAKKLIKINPTLKTKAINKNIIIDKYSDKKL